MRAVSELEVRALLLSRTDYGEADLVLHLFTDTLGKISALARGARKSQRRFGGALEPLHTLELRLIERPRSELLSLKEASLHRTRLQLTQSLPAMETAGRALHWVKRAAPPRITEPLVWSSLERLFDRLENETPSSHDLLLIEFGVHLLDGLGWGLDLSRCVSCNKLCPPQQSAWVNPERGGLVCRACGGGPLLLPGELRGHLLSLSQEESPTLDPRHIPQGLRLIERAIIAHLGVDPHGS